MTLHGEIIGVGRYDAEGDEAEVAFLVEDAHQGRGVGPAAAGAPGAGRTRARHPAIRRRCPAVQHPDAADLPRDGLLHRRIARRRRAALRVPDRADRLGHGRDACSRAACRGRVDRTHLPRAQHCRDRCQSTYGLDRPGHGPQPRARRLQRRGLRRQLAGRGRVGSAGIQDRPGHPGRGGHRDRGGARRLGEGRRARLRRQGRARADRDLRRDSPRKAPRVDSASASCSGSAGATVCD